MFATVANSVALGEQVRAKMVVRFLDNNAAAVALMEASSKVPGALAIIESFRGYAAQLSASCWVEMVSSEANPAGGPERNWPPLRKQALKAQ